MKSLVVFLLAILLYSESSGQISTPSSRDRFGIFAHLNINIHSADFLALPGVPNCCPKFEDGTGTGFSIGGLVELPLFSRFFLSLRGGYSNQNATLLREESVPALRLPDEQFVPDATIEHRIDARIGGFGLEPLLTYNPVGGLLFHAGMRLGFISEIGYEQTEEMMQPGFVFKDTKLRTRNTASGNVENKNTFQTAAILGMSMELPLNRARTLLIAPEVMFQLGLTDLTEGLSWNASAFRIGVALKYSPPAAQPPEAPVLPPAPPVASQPIARAETPKLTPSKLQNPDFGMNITAVNEKGEESSAGKIRVEEFISTQLKPLLPYVFFDVNSAEIPARYPSLSLGGRHSFSVNEAAHAATLDVYYRILDIVAKRLEEYPKATLTLTGCNADALEERGATALSRRRAEAVKAYLTSVWNISAARIRIESQNLPQNPSRTSDADVNDAHAENRRVEISSNEAAILAPVVVRDTLRTIEPQILRLRPSRPTAWRATIVSGGQMLTSLRGNDSAFVEWRPSANLLFGDTVRITIESEGNTVHRTLTTELFTLNRKRTERLADKTVDKYSLILFDFDRSDLSAQNKRIAALVKEAIRPESSVSIIGTTDRLGEAGYNRKLSTDRARAAAAALGISAATFGQGESEEFPNNLPEGRFYNRTVVITVETPVK